MFLKRTLNIYGKQFIRRMSDSCKLKPASNISIKYPEIHRDESVEDDYHGIKIKDPYRWLEDPNSNETIKFVDAQNAVTLPYLDSCIYKKSIKEKITKLWNYPKISEPYRYGNNYFQYINSGLQNQGVIYIQKDLKSEQKVFLDPNTLSEDGTIAISGTACSINGETFAYGLSESGSDWMKIKFRNVNTGEDHKEVLTNVKFPAMTWMHDNVGFLYCAYVEQAEIVDGLKTKTNEYQKLFYHKLGTDQSNDLVVVEFDDPECRISAKVSDCGNYLVTMPIVGCKNNLLYFAQFKDNVIKGKLDLTPVVTEYKAQYQYVTNTGSKFLFRTNDGAPNYRLVIIDFNKPEEKNWVTLIPEHEQDVLQTAKAVNENMLLVTYLHDVKETLLLYDLNTGKKLHDFGLDVGTITAISGERNHREIFFSFYSFLTPNTIYRIDFTEPVIKHHVFQETKVGDFDPAKYETEQVFYSSKDGTKIPMFIIHKKGLVKDGTKPCLLYGYGGFNITFGPWFETSRLVFIDNFDGVYALANIRGGGEYGEKWHNGGKLENKQNCFDDFQYAAKYLADNKYTNSKKLTIQGGSNGGLLVASCINQAPELFGAAICQVGVLDMLRFHKFTIGYAWKSEYGCADVPEEFKILYKYSPLHNISAPKNGHQYPATLLITADHDDRAVPLHSLKFISELQYKIGNLPNQTNPLLIRIETKAGHGDGKPTSKLIDEDTDILCFIANSLGLKFKE